MYWYVEQLFNKLYDSEALPFTLPKEYYGLGKDQIFLQNRINKYVEVKDLLEDLKKHPKQYTAMYGAGEKVLVLPTKRFKITLDKEDLIQRGVITAEQAETMPNEIRWEINRDALYRHQLVMLDILATNTFKRDINIMNPGYIKDVFPLVDAYSVQEGMVYKLTPYAVNSKQKFNSDKTYDYFMNGDGTGELKWGNLNSPDIYIDNAVTLNSSIVQRQTFGMLAEQLIAEGKVDKAKDMLDMAEKFFPKENFPLDKYSIFFIQLYIAVNDMEKAKLYFDEVLKLYEQELAYYSQFKGNKARGVQGDLQEAAQAVYMLYSRTNLDDPERIEKASKVLETYVGRI
jgi:hypothetical protein